MSAGSRPSEHFLSDFGDTSAFLRWDQQADTLGGSMDAIAVFPSPYA
jgi:hypothetical protein